MALGNTGDDPTHARQVRGGGARSPVLLFGMSLLVLAAVLLSLVWYAARRPPASRAAAPAAPSPTPTTAVLYQANWSAGSQSWTLPQHWHLVDGHIENDGQGTDPLMVPFYVTRANYTVQADMTVLKVPNTPVNHTFGIEGLDKSGQRLFLGDLYSLTPSTNHGFALAYVTHSDSQNDMLATQDTSIPYNTETYMVQVQNNNLLYCGGPSCLNHVNSSVPLWPVHIEILDAGVQLTLTRLVITSP